MTWENDPTSGIIPRALAQLFDELRVQSEAEFSVRVSFLELYNKEIFDLLSAADDITRLRLYEDSARKGSVIIQGSNQSVLSFQMKRNCIGRKTQIIKGYIPQQPLVRFYIQF